MSPAEEAPNLPVNNMPDDDRSIVKDIQEAPKDTKSERGMANTARDNQIAPEDLKEQQGKHEEMRREGRTPSSADLPSVALDGGLTANTGSVSDAFKAAYDKLDAGVTKALDGGPYIDPGMMVNDLSVKGQPDAKDPKVDTADANKSAKDIEDAFHWYKADEFDKVNKSLEGKSPDQIKAIDDEFKKTHDNKSIEEVLNERWGKDHPDKLEAAKKLLHPEGEKKPEAPKETPEEVKLRDGKALDSIKKDPEVQKRHDELEKHAKETMKEPELGKFLNNMNKFEEREASMQHQYQKELESKGMKPEEAAKEAEKKSHEQIEKSYENLDRLMAKNDKAPVNQADRVMLAQQAMEHAADTKTISQGSYGTCYAAATETRTYARDPAEATRLVADVATTGKYTSNGGVTVELDKNSLKRQGDAKDPPPKGENSRDFASQLFEVTAINVELEKQNRSTNPPGKLRYEQREPQPGSNPEDHGERLMNYATKPPTIEKKSFGMDPHSIADMQKEISPSAGEGVTGIDSFQVAELQKKILDIDLKKHDINGGKPVDTNDPEWATKTRKAIEEKEGLEPKKKEEMLKELSDLEKTVKEDKDGHVVHAHNEQEMKDALKQAKESGKLPIYVHVDTNNEPFWTDSKGGDAGGSGGPHVLTVTDYDPDTGKCTVQNQWDSASNHEVSSKQLFEATRMTSDSLEDLQKTAKESRDSGHPDYMKEYEVLRFQKAQGKISDEEYDRKVTELTIERYKALKEGKLQNDDEYRRASREAALMVDHLVNSKDPAEQARGKKIQAAVAQGVKDVNAAHP